MNAEAVAQNNEVNGPTSKDFARLKKLIEKAVEKFDGADTPDSLKEKVLAELDEERAGVLGQHFLGNHVLSSIESNLKSRRVQARQLHFDALEQIELVKDGVYSHHGSRFKVSGNFVHAIGATDAQWLAKAEILEAKHDARAMKKARECRYYARLLAANNCNTLAELSAKKKLVVVSPNEEAKSAKA